MTTSTATPRSDMRPDLRNRGLFDVLFEHECGRARRYDSMFAVVAVGVDALERIVEQFGPAAGEQVLGEVASLLQQNIRESDFAARSSDSEFLVLLPEGGLGMANGFAHRLHRQVAVRTFEMTGQAIRPTLSIGVVSRRNLPTLDPAELLPAAQTCLRLARAGGGDRTCFRSYDETHFTLAR